MTMDLAATQDAFAAALLDPALPVPAGVTSARGKADAKRFAVYRNNVAVGLTRVLASRFPVVEKLVGKEFFAGMARAYIARTRPSSPLILAYGDSFPAFIGGFEPAAGVPYLADVARLEAAWTRAYHAADIAPLDIAALSALDASGLAAARLTPHPAAMLVRSRFPVGSIWQAHQSDPVVPVSKTAANACWSPAPGSMSGFIFCPPGTRRLPKPSSAGLRSAMRPSRRAGPTRTFDFGTALAGLFTLGAFSADRAIRGSFSDMADTTNAAGNGRCAAFLAPVRRAEAWIAAIPEALPLLALRLALAVPFFKSGLTKWDGFLTLSAGAHFLFEQEFRLHIFGAADPVPRAGARRHARRRRRNRAAHPARAWTCHAFRRAWNPGHDRRHPAYRAGRLGQFPPALGRHGADACRLWRRRACDRPGDRHRPAARLRAADAGGRAVERIVAAAPAVGRYGGFFGLPRNENGHFGRAASSTRSGIAAQQLLVGLKC